jgi:hypothetical protein
MIEGQNYRFSQCGPERYAIDRYVKETARLYIAWRYSTPNMAAYPFPTSSKEKASHT